MLCATVVFLSPAILFCIYALLARVLLPSPRTSKELADVLQLVPERELLDLFDKRKEQNLSSALSRSKFQEAQRNRARLLFEYLRRIYFNALMLLLWAYAYRDQLVRIGEGQSERAPDLVRQLVQTGTQVRLYGAIAIFKVTLRLILDRFDVPIGSLEGLRYAARIDGLEAYRRLADVAAALSTLDDSQATPRLLHLLRGTDLPL